MMSVEIGDRIIINDNISAVDRSLAGLSGRIVDIIKYSVSDSSFGIEFDEGVGGHDCGGKGSYGHCWYVNPRSVTLLSECLEHKFNEDEDAIYLNDFLKEFKGVNAIV